MFCSVCVWEWVSEIWQAHYLPRSPSGNSPQLPRSSWQPVCLFAANQQCVIQAGTNSSSSFTGQSHTGVKQHHVSSSEASEESQLNKTLVCVIKSDRKLSQRVFRVLCCRFHGDLRSHYSANKNLQAKHQAQAFAGCWLTRMCRLVIFDCFSSFVGKSSSPVACRAVAVYRRRVTLSGWYGMGKGLRLNWQRKRGNCQGTTVVWLGPVLAQGDLILWSAQG